MESGLTSTLAGFAPPQYVKDFVPLVALLVASIGLVVAIRNSRIANTNYAAGRIRDIRDQLKDEASLDILRADLSHPTLRDAWRARVERLIATLEGWFGQPWSWRAFDVSLRIAFVYPMFLFALAWLAGASGKVGTVNILPDGLPLWRRSATLAIAIGAAAYFVKSLRNARRLSRPADATFQPSRADAPPRQIERSLRSVLIFIAFTVAVFFALALAFAFLSAFAGEGSSAFAGASALIFLVAGAFYRKDAFLVALAVSFAFAFAVAVAGVGAGIDAFRLTVAIGPEFGIIIYATFFVILPLANAAFDFASWLATRKLLDRMAREREGWRGAAWIVVEIVLDLSLAALCLAGLAASMAFLLEAMNAFLTWRGVPIFDWRAYIDAARARPAYDPSNWTTVGMLASTVAPTALHLAAGLSGVVTAFFPNGRALAARIGPKLSEIERQELAADIHRFQNRRRVLAAILAPLILIALLWLLWITLGAWLPSLYDLADRSAAFWRR